MFRGYEWRIGKLVMSCFLWIIDEVLRGVVDGVDWGLLGVRV